MPTQPLTLAKARAAVAACDKALREGHPAPSKANGRTGRSALNAAAAALGVPRVTLEKRLRRARELHGLAPKWAKVATERVKLAPPPAPPRVAAAAATTRVVVMTAAQDETGLVERALPALEAYAAHRGGEIFIGGFTYQKGLFEDHSVRTGLFTPAVQKYLRPDVVDLAPRLVWHGRANILPTAGDPLTGWETQTRDAWAVFPHAKIALKSVPVMPGRPGKQIMTTGVVTRANYVQRNAGQKAEFHHTVGATVAEIAPDGTFFCRQIKIARDGSFQDLDMLVRNGRVERAPPIEAATWGDIHFEQLDEAKARASWGWPDGAAGSMLDVLKPKHQFIHDSFDFTARSHHTRNDPHERARRIVEGRDSVAQMLDGAAAFIAGLRRDWSRVVHVASNHNIHLEKWLKDPDGAFDPVNARLWHQLNADWHGAIEAGDDTPPHARALAQRLPGALADVTFLREGESYVICQGVHPIECGLHAHIGPRGARGSPASLSKIVERVNGAHTHEPCIREAAYFAGTSGRLDMPYASKGPGAWHHADIVTYASGARTIVTHQNGRWRA